MSNISQHLCVFWFTATWNANFASIKIQSAWTVSWFISIKKEQKKTNEIRSRNLAVYCWLPCLPHYLSWKWLLRIVATLTSIWPRIIVFEKESDIVVFFKVWHHPYFRHVIVWVPVIAYYVITKHFVTRYGSEHIYICALYGMLCCCMRIFKASFIECEMEKKWLLTEMLFFSEQNVR